MNGLIYNKRTKNFNTKLLNIGEEIKLFVLLFNFCFEQLKMRMCHSQTHKYEYIHIS